MATIIFDFDGTIADSFDYVADFMATERGIPELSTSQRHDLRSLSMIGMARRLGFHWWQLPMLFFKGRRQMSQSIKKLNSFRGMPELIRKLNAEGHELFVLSNNSVRNVRTFLHKHKIHEYFLQIYGSVGFLGKGSALRQLLKEQNLEVEHAVYVGDELRDVEAAQSIGLRAVAVSWGFASRQNLVDAKPTGLADNVDELMRILEEI
jgi:phosphoglycolate phosphatase-like HAD superfamily hydrolase